MQVTFSPVFIEWLLYMYVLTSYAVGAAVLRAGEKGCPSSDRVFATLGWLVSPLWVPLWALSKLLFCGVK